MQIIQMKLSEIKPYEHNPRHNDESVEFVANSIKEFGFKQPIVVDTQNVIVAGHTRYKAAERLELETVPVIVADDLSEEEIKAYRLADNKTAESSTWDLDVLNDELDGIFDIDMADFGFSDPIHIEWDDVADLSEENYSEPTESNIKCPKCGYIGSKHYFVKAEE